jgi:hypothetical protein
MITLKGSKYIVEHDDNATTDTDYKVFIRENKELKDITNALTDDDKTELISDLIYSLTDLLKQQS